MTEPKRRIYCLLSSNALNSRNTYHRNEYCRNFCVTFTEVLIIYLSAGAPFGVLLLFSRQSKFSFATLIHTVLATVFWPYFAISRVRHHYESLVRKRNDVTGILPFPNRGADNIWFRELGFKMTAIEREVVDGYFELTQTLHESLPAEAFRSAELFEIAGHSNPRSGARCIARSRRAHLASKQTAAASSFVHLMDRKMLEGSSIPLPLVESSCMELNDVRTALQIELLIQKKLKLGNSPENTKSTELGQGARII